MAKGVMSTVFAVMAAVGLVVAGDAGIELAQADQCVQQCRSAHNQCRITSKGSPSCDSQLQACMDSCRSRR
jgi:hypothetical protein